MTKQYKRVISIGAHPLDAELMGGPMCLHYNSRGAKSTMYHVTTGRLENKDATEEEKTAYLEGLNTQIKNVADHLGCDVIQKGYLSSNMPSETEFIKVVYDYLKEEQADLVITHHIGTMHDRHYYTHKCVTHAVKLLRNEGVSIDLFYGENLEDLVGFVPTKYLQLTTDEVEQWFNALGKYDIFNGGVNTVPYVDYYRTMGRVRGLESSCPGFVKAYMHAGQITYSND